MPKVAFIAILAVCLVGCGSSPSQPPPDALVGVWHIVGASLTRDGEWAIWGPEGSLEFRADNTIAGGFMGSGLDWTAQELRGSWQAYEDLYYVSWNYGKLVNRWGRYYLQGDLLCTYIIAGTPYWIWFEKEQA